MRAMLRRAALAAIATTAAAISVVAGCDTYFFIGNDPVAHYQVCEDGSLECFATTGTGGSGGAPPGCVPSVDNKAVDDTCGVFVSPEGSDEDGSGDGSQDKPYRTLGKAVLAAVTGERRVYACADASKPFDEALELEGELTIYGGLSCTNGWSYDPKAKSAWTAPADAVPLRVTAGSIAVYDFTVTARDAEKTGGSSIAVLVAGDKAEVTLERCDVTAGAGKAGTPGVTPDTIGPNNEGAAGAAGGNGDDGDGNAGTMANVCTAMNPAVGGAGGQNQCGDTDVAGGLGGTGTNGNDGLAGQDGKPMPNGMEGTGGKPEDAKWPLRLWSRWKSGPKRCFRPGRHGHRHAHRSRLLGCCRTKRAGSRDARPGRRRGRRREEVREQQRGSRRGRRRCGRLRRIAGDGRKQRGREHRCGLGECQSGDVEDRDRDDGEGGRRGQGRQWPAGWRGR